VHRHRQEKGVMAQNGMRLLVDCWKRRPPKQQPGGSRAPSVNRCAHLWTVQTTLLVVIVLVGGVLLLDSYKWRRFSFPWSSDGPYEVLDRGAVASNDGYKASLAGNNLKSSHVMRAKVLVAHVCRGLRFHKSKCASLSV